MGEHDVRFRARVLIVEDDPHSEFRLRALLEESSLGVFQVEASSTMAAAKAAIGSVEFDAVLLDLGLPDSQGAATVAEMSAAAPQLPLLVVTHSDEEDLVGSCLAAGADDFTTKSDATTARLAVSIVQAVTKRRAQAELLLTQDKLERVAQALRSAGSKH